MAEKRDDPKEEERRTGRNGAARSGAGGRSRFRSTGAPVAIVEKEEIGAATDGPPARVAQAGSAGGAGNPCRRIQSSS